MSDIRLKLIQSPTLKCVVRPFFPGSVAAGLGISVSLVGNAYTIAFNAATAGLVIGTNIQAWDADLDAVANFGSTGFAVRIAANTWAQRQLVAPAAGVTITNPAGIAGNPTFALANDLAALEALASNGFAERTGTDTWQITGFTGTGDVARAASPAFTGTPTAPTAATSTNTTQIATTAFVQQELATNNVTGAWTTYSPTVTPNTGTITTLGTVTGRHKKIGRIVHFEVDVNITTNGTGAGFINISMPFTSAAFPYFAVGQELNVTGNMLIGHVQASSTNMAVTTSAGAYPGGDGRRLTLSGFYEASS